MRLPAVCMACGLVFEAGSFLLTHASEITALGNFESCPKCKGWAVIPDGTYTTINNALEVVRGSQFTRQQVEILREYRANLLSTKRSKDDSIPDEVIDAIASIQPELGAAVRLLKKGKIKWAGLLLFIGLLIVKCEGGEGITIIDARKETHVTQIIQAPKAAPTRLEDSILYYSHDPKKKKAGNNPNPAASRPDPKQK